MRAKLKLLVISLCETDFERIREILANSHTPAFTVTHSSPLLFAGNSPAAGIFDLALVFIPVPQADTEIEDSDRFDMIRKHSPEIPFIALLEEENEALETRLLETGVREVLCKNELHLRYLLKAIRHTLEHHELREKIKKLENPGDCTPNFFQGFSQSLIDHIGEGVIFADKNEVMLYVNPAAEVIFGLPMEKLVGSNLLEFLEPEQVEIVKKQTQMRAGGKKNNYELEIKTDSGECRNILVTGNPWFDDNREFIGTFGVFRDISHQIESKKNLLLLKKALETMKVGVTITNLKREIIYINPAEATMHGYTVEEIKSGESRIFGLKSSWKALTVEDVKKMESWERESTNLRKGGNIFPVHLISDVVKNERDEPIGIVTCCMDITARKEAEKALRSTTEYLRGILESQLDLVIRFDSAGRFTYANDAYCRTFAMEREQLIGSTFSPKIHAEDRKKMAALQGLLNMPPYRVYYELHTETVEGWRWLAWQGYALRDDSNNIVEIQSVGRDVTEQKEMEAELRLYATTDTMTGVQNRRTGMLLLEKSLQMSRRNHHFLVVCFVDINNLKMVNDKFGHSEGDELICDVSKILRASLRKTDTICRLGGDEFLIVFPNCSLIKARMIWERILVRRDAFNRKTEKSYPITFSHGFAEYKPGETITPEALVGIADKEMYKEKMHGKEPRPEEEPRRDLHFE
ncbi:MAG: PAS domain S-box protein [bacterium]|nr:PAS domain S-box protein [bacterium]